MIIDLLKKSLKNISQLFYGIIIVKNRMFKFFSFFGKSNETIFSNFYNKNKWGDNESFSGCGSTVEATIETRKIVKKIIEDYKIKSFLDIPCGDFNWMKLIDFKECKYYGSDIVKKIIENNKKYESKNIKFFKSNITKDRIEKYDLIFCRDCLVHLSNKDISKSLKNIKKSNSRFLLTTIFPFNKKNQWIASGMWRPLNLMKKPFLLPKPTALYIESEDKFSRKERYKYLALWEIKKI